MAQPPGVRDRAGPVVWPRPRPAGGSPWPSHALPIFRAPVLWVWLWVMVAFPARGDVVEHFFTVGVATLSLQCTYDRPSVVVNGQWPGPTIYANDGDVVKVHVFNNQTLPITIHWHGISQAGSQWYDGVPGVTQCEIQYRKTYTHIFRIAGEWGTFWWHSHVAQLRNTLHGALIVRPPPNYAEPLTVPISNELLFLGGDWYKETAEQLMDTIGAPPYPGYPTPKALHLNGRSLCKGLQFFTVRRYRWYRIRVINTAMWASFNLRIANHSMVLHETEGGYLARRRVTSLDVYPGQSYSVILYTGQAPTNYWIVLHPIYDVAKAGVAPGLAVLSYLSPHNGPVLPNTRIPAAPSSAQKNVTGILFQGRLTSASLNQELPTARVNKLIVLEINQNTYGNRIQYSINNVTFSGAAIPFLLADWRNVSSQVYNTSLTPDLPPLGLLTKNDGPANVGPGVIEIPYGAMVQVVWQNHASPGGMHPWHLHGYNFWVVGQGNGRFNISRWNKYKYNLRSPPWRNTVAMFDGTWVAIRFRATNPGQWIFHCHLEQHADLGLATVFKVKYPTSGTRVPPLSPPPADYPVCAPPS